MARKPSAQSTPGSSGRGSRCSSASRRSFRRQGPAERMSASSPNCTSISMTFSPTASAGNCSVIEKLRRLVLHLAAIAAIGRAPAVALAHAFLNQAAPPVGGTVPASPKEIRLTFSEGIEPRFSGIDLATDGPRVATGAPAVEPATDKQLVLAPPPLAPGRYRVRWHVVSVDTHRTEGEYSFVLAPCAPAMDESLYPWRVFHFTALEL